MQHRFICLAAVFLCAIGAHADGIYIPDYHAKPPSIPSQRAIIVYKDGVERLQVESMVQSEGSSVAWILPVPATPTDIHEASPGFLKTLFLNIRPAIKGDEGLAKGYDTARLAAAMVALWSVGVLVTGRRFRSVWFSLLLAAIPCVVFAFYHEEKIPTLSAGAMGDAPTRIVRASVVGNYDVSVLEARDGAALDAWLKQNGFAALQAEGQAIADDYIKEGWRFVAARLRTERGQRLRPHPLDITFPARQPVYPMRLTALAKSDVYVELFVASDKAAANGYMDTHLVGRFEASRGRQHGLSTHEIDTGLKWKMGISHPDTLNYLYDGCIVTRLEGTFRPSDMDEDVVLRLKTPTLMRATLRSFSARHKMVWTSVLLFGAFALAPMVFAATLQATAARRRAGVAVAMLTVTLLSAGLGYYRWTTIPAIDAVDFLHNVSFEERPRLVESDQCLSIAHHYLVCRPDFLTLPPAEQIALFREFLTYVPTYNWALNDSIRFEDSPGNVTFAVRDGEMVATLYQGDGRPWDWSLETLGNGSYGRNVPPFPVEGGDPKALEQVFKDLKSNKSRAYTQDPITIDVLVAVVRAPQRLSGPAIAVVEQAIQGEKTRGWVLDLAVGALGLATKTVPPQDITDHEALKAFLVQVKSQLQTQATAPTPGG